MSNRRNSGSSDGEKGDLVVADGEAPAGTPTPAEVMMARETRVTYAAVSHTLSNAPLAEMSWQILGDSFLLRTEGEQYFHYRKGEGIFVEQGPGADRSEESLWLNGSVHAAVASINGLLPVHASAVAVEGQVFAFTGPPGAGKSTLVAALGDRGLPMFCDDTLVLDLSDPDRIICLPGHKRLKLSASALELTGATQEEKVSRTVEKFYARPASGSEAPALPLAELIFLEEGAEAAITPIHGAERMVRMQDDHQTALLFSEARRLNRSDHFTHLARLARQIPMSLFTRPRDKARFDAGVDIAYRHVTGRPGHGQEPR